jgi:HAD superfamily hydrolase (TIGR01509 family)
MPRFAILDIDGTLVDSNDAHADAWLDAFAHFGFRASRDEVRRLIGKGGDKLVPEVTGLHDPHRHEAISTWRSEVFAARYLARIRAFPEVRPLLQRMRREGLTLVVASSAREDEVGTLLDIAGVRDLVAATTSADDASRSKPDPDIVSAALRQAGCAPGDAVMLGDTPYDLAAARAAGVGFVGLRCGGWDDAAFGTALAVYQDPADLLAGFDTSPFARQG